MGMFDGGGDDGMSDRLDRQQREADRKLEIKRKALERQRMRIVQSQGGQLWENPDQPAPTEPTDASPPGV
jgi:hypothetical protein